MYCYSCGKQIRDDSAFCQFCGAKQNNINSVTTNNNGTLVKKNSNGEYDREALKIYLGNILSLECIKARYSRNISDYNYKINNINNNNYYERYLLHSFNKGYRREFYAHFFYNQNGFYVSVLKGGSHIWEEDKNSGYYSGDSFYEPCWKLLPKENPILQYSTVKHWKDYYYGDGIFEKMRRCEIVKDAFISSFNDFAAKAPQIYKQNLEKVNKLTKDKNGISNELATVNKLLRQAYDINIIPSNFRNNIHAIYYLHDFVSTSQESFTTALLHFDLNEIKAKLDKIIAQQETIIIQNAIMMSQNEKMMKQNEEKLLKLSQIEENTSQASQYAQIAANNSEICAWISMANYIERKKYI